MRRRTWSRGVLAVCCVVALAGCAQVPTSGPVTQGDGVQAGVDEPFIRVLPQVPTPGMSPLAIVRGFLASSASFDGDHAVARDYLSSEAAATWNAAAGVVVYNDEYGFSLRSLGRHWVEFRAPVVATMNSDGSLTPARNVNLTRKFRLERVNGEWRIANPPRGLLLTRLDVSRSYRPLNLYFVSPQAPFLVPDPIYVPVVRPGAATSLVRALLDGPTPWLAPAVRTAFPRGTGLVVDAVPVENGTAQVNLSSDVLKASQSDLAALTAQLVWTLSQLPEVTGVEIQADGVPLTISQSSGVQTTQDWQVFDPNASPATDIGLGVVSGKIVQLTGTAPTALPGALGSGHVAVSSPAQSWSGQQVAAVSEDGTTVYLQTEANPSQAVPILRAQHVVSLSFDGFGDLWVVDQQSNRSILEMLTASSLARADHAVPRPVPITLRRPPGRWIDQLRVARDGTRVALVLTASHRPGELVLARVVRQGRHASLSGFKPLERTLTNVQSVAWAASDQLAVLAQQRGAAVQPWLVGVDASVSATGGALPGAVDLTAAPGLPVLAATGNGRVWEDTGLSWRQLARASDPAYSG